MMFLPIFLAIATIFAGLALGMSDQVDLADLGLNMLNGISYFDAGGLIPPINIHNPVIYQSNSTVYSILTMLMKVGDETMNPAIQSFEVVWVMPRVLYSDNPTKNKGHPSSLVGIGCSVWSSLPGNDSGNANEQCYLWGPQLNMYFSVSPTTASVW
jgi:hypothetical protein